MSRPGTPFEKLLAVPLMVAGDLLLLHLAFDGHGINWAELAMAVFTIAATVAVIRLPWERTNEGAE